MDLGALQLFIIALLPSIGTLITALTVCFSICKKFVELRKEVKDDKTINAILSIGKFCNKVINAQYKAALDKLDELSEKIEAMAVANEDLAMSIKNDKET